MGVLNKITNSVHSHIQTMTTNRKRRGIILRKLLSKNIRRSYSQNSWSGKYFWELMGVAHDFRETKNRLFWPTLFLALVAWSTPRSPSSFTVRRTDSFWGKLTNSADSKTFRSDFRAKLVAEVSAKMFRAKQDLHSLGPQALKTTLFSPGGLPWKASAHRDQRRTTGDYPGDSTTTANSNKQLRTLVEDQVQRIQAWWNLASLAAILSNPQHSSAFLSIPQHNSSAFLSIPQHSSARNFVFPLSFFTIALCDPLLSLTHF